MRQHWLIIETSDKPGAVALAVGARIVGGRTLDEARRHARDLAPAVVALLAEQGWRARELDGVIVSRGPGSYTGLRVGIMSAKTLAYAVGCRLLAVDTFAAIARQAPAEANWIDVVADAQQDKLYRQRFRRDAAGQELQADALTILPAADWIGALPEGTWVSGPGLAAQLARLPAEIHVVAESEWRPRAESLLALGLGRFERGESDDPFTVEPLYLRPSSAEEKWRQGKSFELLT